MPRGNTGVNYRGKDLRVSLISLILMSILIACCLIFGSSDEATDSEKPSVFSFTHTSEAISDASEFLV